MVQFLLFKKTYVDSGILDPKKSYNYTQSALILIFFIQKIIIKKFIVTAVGNDFIRKGFKYLVDGFNKLDLDNSELWIIGNYDKNLPSKIVKLKKIIIFFKLINLIYLIITINLQFFVYLR